MFFERKKVFLCIAIFFLLSSFSFGQVVVGEYVEFQMESSHPYQKPDTNEHLLVFEQEIFHPKSTYIAIHFAKLDLAPGDVLVVRSPDSNQYWEYRDQGRRGLGLHPDGFFATHIKGEMAVVELFAKGHTRSYGFEIDFYGRGYSDDELQELWDAGLGEALNLAEPRTISRSICTTDDSEEVKCFEQSEPEVYEEARAVARLLLNGSTWCTGWLIGCDGHIMTNEHCIGSQSQLNNIDFEFDAEGMDCSTNCASALACQGTIEASGGTMIQVNAALDFALVLPDTSAANQTDLPATYGFMELRPSGAVLNEQIYIPQHPAGWGKRVAFNSSYPDDVNGLAQVNSISEPPCSGSTPDVGYWADTQGGSSGSPVLGYSDHKVIALHHCRGSAGCASGNPSSEDPNRGVPIQAIIDSLGSNVPNCAICPPVAEPTNLMGQTNGDNQIDLTWTPPSVDGAVLYNVYRSEGGCATGDFQLIAEQVSSSNYSDTTVSGGTTYGYAVRVYDNSTSCESPDSNCIDVMATGTCLLDPTFAGISGATNAATAMCVIQLSWDTATARCGSNVVYNIYRDTTSGFTPGPGNLLASGVTGTSFQDDTADSGVTYFYVVRAEDDSGNGSGPHAGGIEDTNMVEAAAAATGPDDVEFEDNMEAGIANWVAAAGPGDPGGTDPWVLSTAQSHSPSNSWFVSDEPTNKDQVVGILNDVAISSPNAKLVFWHHYNTELNWDGGVLEYSIDGGSSWQDILAGDGGSIPANENRFISGGYVGSLRSGSNPVGGRLAWFGDNNGFEQVSVDLSDMNGTSLRIRWRFGCDGSVGDEGWYVDNVQIFIPSECNFECIYDQALPNWPNISIIDLMQCLPGPK